jgi:hypothetical protein
MSGQPVSTLQVPESLKQQLWAFRRRVWTIKFIEAAAIVVVGFGIAFLGVYAVDRLAGMPATMRAVVLAAAAGTLVLIPWFVYRWVMRLVGLEPLARLLGERLPAVGDQLLGVIELSKNDSEQARSPALCQAAMQQVANDAAKRDFTQATPRCHYRAWASFALLTTVIVATIAAIYPAASANALARLMMPWKEVPRYTFTRIEAVPANWIVAHGEPVTLRVKLQDDSRWQPIIGNLTLGGQTVAAELRDGEYGFVLPPQISDQAVQLRIGDVIERLTLVPTLRPELSSVTAQVKLPEYLSKPEPVRVDSRAGTVAVVRGSEAIFTATANRDLAAGEINRQPRQPEGASLASDAVGIESESMLEFKWKDHLGLEGRAPFALSVNPLEDEAPTLICDGLPRQAVVLDSESLSFNVRANDDFGVRRVGMMWRGLYPEAAEKLASGEKPLAPGGPDATNLEVMGTFSAKSLGIEPQPIELMVWAEDYLPGRPRVYSAPHIFYVLTPDQHAIWMTEQLSKWHRQALDVRDTERQLYEKNKELRGLSAEELDQEENRRQVQRQAAAETSNGKRLERLGEVGDQLVRAAARNPEIGVGHLERWAEMLQVLSDLSENRMPSVADLLKDAAAAKPQVAAGETSKPRIAGQSRSDQPGGAGNEDPEQPKPAEVPKLVDAESSMNSPDEGKMTPGEPKKPSSGSLRLPVTTVMGKASGGDQDQPPTQQESIDQAVKEQEDLLAEFDRLADELNTVLANLEGSTLVKRLKAASREQNVIAGKLTEQLQPAFGVTTNGQSAPVRQTLTALQETEQASSQNISFIMDDLAAYFERRRLAPFKAVLDEMKSEDVIGGLRKLAAEIPVEQGISIAQAEFWADTIDRWAENLVDPACKGTCPGGKSPDSLPPSIVLEVLQILEAEINLRDETRVAQQAMPELGQDGYKATATKLSEMQNDIGQRVAKVIARIIELPDSNQHFGKELNLLAEVNSVMDEATEILAQPETGPPAIAAQTEAIELLLRSKRINPKGGGGGGSSPGGGGSGTTTDSALALLGKGTNQKEVREDRGVNQSTGETGTVLPEEFRRGLDQYFNRLGG